MFVLHNYRKFNTRNPNQCDVVPINKSDNTEGIDRRRLLRRLGAAGTVAATGLPGFVSAATLDGSGIERVRARATMRQLESETGGLRVSDGRVRTLSSGETVQMLETDAGTVIDDGEVSILLVESAGVFGRLRGKTGGLTDGLDASYRQAALDGTLAVVSNGSDVVYNRSATPEELATVRESVEGTVLNARVTTGTDGIRAFSVADGTLSIHTVGLDGRAELVGEQPLHGGRLALGSSTVRADGECGRCAAYVAGYVGGVIGCVVPEGISSLAGCGGAAAAAAEITRDGGDCDKCTGDNVQ